jgi:hypothetical protein
MKPLLFELNSETPKQQQPNTLVGNHRRLLVGVISLMTTLVCRPRKRRPRLRASYVVWQMFGFLGAFAIAATLFSTSGSNQHNMYRNRRELTGTPLTSNSTSNLTLTNCPLSETGLSIVSAIGSQLCLRPEESGCLYCCSPMDTPAMSLVYLLVVFYTFLGLAIVCDEYFCEVSIDFFC